MTQSVVRREGLSRWRFVRDYLWPNRPVVVTGALNDWVGLTKWNIAFFQSKLGHEPVRLQGDTFKRTRTIPFAEFLEALATYEELPASAPQFLEEFSYVRRRSWSDTQQTTLHTLIAKDWSRPNFLPSSLYLWPLDLLSSSPNLHRYPAFGVYISPRGAVTGLHVDPRRSSAVLCQISGTKQGFLFPPSKTDPWQDEKLTSASARRARKIDVLHGRSPDYRGMTAVRFDLQPGEVLYIPMGWAHEVFTTSTSISLTYNFIHLWGHRLPFGKHKKSKRGSRKRTSTHVAPISSGWLSSYNLGRFAGPLRRNIRLNIRVFIYGKVQNVGLQNWLAKRAKEAGVVGWVRNRSDGCVEAVFEGRYSAVEELLARCREGPRRARISEIIVQSRRARSKRPDFWRRAEALS